MTTNQTAKERIERAAEECGAMILAAELRGQATLFEGEL